MISGSGDLYVAGQQDAAGRDGTAKSRARERQGRHRLGGFIAAFARNPSPSGSRFAPPHVRTTLGSRFRRRSRACSSCEHRCARQCPKWRLLLVDRADGAIVLVLRATCRARTRSWRAVLAPRAKGPMAMRHAVRLRGRSERSDHGLRREVRGHARDRGQVRAYRPRGPSLPVAAELAGRRRFPALVSLRPKGRARPLAVSGLATSDRA